MPVPCGDSFHRAAQRRGEERTLLKILSYSRLPALGSLLVRVKGRLASRLEAGTGFHREIIRREHIYGGRSRPRVAKPPRLGVCQVRKVMTKIAILPEPAESGQITYRAISGRQQSVGKTAGEALDSLTSCLPGDDSATLVIVQRQRPDRFFTAEQQTRLQELMGRWRLARDGGPALAPAGQVELEGLIEAEVRAAGERTATLLRELEP